MKVSGGTFQCECDLKQTKKKRKKTKTNRHKIGAQFLLYQTLCKSLEAAKDIRKYKKNLKLVWKSSLVSPHPYRYGGSKYHSVLRQIIIKLLIIIKFFIFQEVARK